MSRAALSAAAAALVAALIAPTTSMASTESSGPASSSAAPSSLTVSPGVYVAGQALVFRGALGRAGHQQVHLQTHMDRPGDTWLDLEGSDARTRPDGSFRISRPAPGMTGIRYRAVSEGRAGPVVTMYPRVQEVLLQPESGLPGFLPGEVLAGHPFTIRVDTTPVLPGALQSPTPIPGRTLALEQRVSGSAWQPVSTTSTDSAGQGLFALTAGQPGDLVYRVRLEDWSVGRNEIGWHPSFPTYVHVLGATLEHQPKSARSRPPHRHPCPPKGARVRRPRAPTPGARRPTASSGSRASR